MKIPAVADRYRACGRSGPRFKGATFLAKVVAQLRALLPASVSTALVAALYRVWRLLRLPRARHRLPIRCGIIGAEALAADACGAAVVPTPGDLPGMPTRAELDRLLAGVGPGTLR